MSFWRLYMYLACFSSTFLSFSNYAKEHSFLGGGKGEQFYKAAKFLNTSHCSLHFNLKSSSIQTPFHWKVWAYFTWFTGAFCSFLKFLKSKWDDHIWCDIEEFPDSFKISWSYVGGNLFLEWTNECKKIKLFDTSYCISSFVK